MGADAQILLSGVESRDARATVETAVAEIERLERILSLFRPESDICRLNRDGFVGAPAADLRHALALALATADATGGLFDPTVQPLWETTVDWFTTAAEGRLPPDAVIAPARRAVDYRRIELRGNEVRLGHGQRITLNGLGQGYVTDRVADLIRQRGFPHVLVDLGEQRALGPRAGGEPWLISRQGSVPLRLTRGALATSEGSGCILGANGAAHHLFDPRTGRSAAHWRSITAHHGSAAVADALSTALYAASADEMATILSRLTDVVVWTTDHRGRRRRWESPATQPPGVTG